MQFDVRPDLLFLAIEAMGVSLTGVLLTLLGRETGRDFVRWWAVGWTLLAVSVASFLLWQALGGSARVLLLPYLAGGYGFAVLVVRGFAAFREVRTSWRREAWWAAALTAWTAGVLTLASTAEDVLRLHALALAFLLLVALDEARKTDAPGGHRTGRRVALLALLALTVNFAGFGLLGWLGAWEGPAAEVLLPFNALIDLVLLTALGFGQALLVMETVSAALAQSNRQLEAARDLLEVQARVDPLTSALNRHAFHSLLGGRDEDLTQRGGCVVVIDIDRLKEVNDTRGHAAGDEMIRTAAAMIRRVVRADDLLFRWGGDEFLAILFGLAVAGVDARLRGLREHRDGTPSAPSLSWGIAPFDTLTRIGDAIEAADRAMYDGRARRGHEPGARH